MGKEEEFVAEYKKVFNESEAVRVCGREECKRLIQLADEIDNSVEHGRAEVGMMNTDSIKSLYERIIGK
jgi:hypothetical protein